MSLLDKYLPRRDFSERHSCMVAADRQAILNAIARYRPDDDALFKLLIGLRELPMRLARKITGSKHLPPAPFGLHNFTLLETSDREVVYGLAGAFWQADFGLIEIKNGHEFLSLDNAAAAQLLLGFSIADGAPNRLTTETRAFCPTAEVRRKFAPYWYLIRPFSGLIRRRILQSIRRSAERG